MPDKILFTISSNGTHHLKWIPFPRSLRLVNNLAPTFLVAICTNFKIGAQKLQEILLFVSLSNFILFIVCSVYFYKHLF